MRITRVIAGALAGAALLACEPISEPTTDGMLQPTFSMGAGVTQSVTGSAHYHWMGPGGSFGEPKWRTSSFNARKYADGSVHGKYQSRVHGADNWFKGRIVCFTISGNEAWLGVVVDEAYNPDLVGSKRKLYVKDNGEGSNDFSDVSTSLPPLRPTDFPTLEEYCEAQPPFADFALHEIEAGNIQVRGDGESGSPVGGESATLLSAGGPDDFGYQFLDSDEPGGPAYDFEDISGSGTPISLGDDQVSGAIPIGFTFGYYGIDYADIYVSSNGFLTVLPGQSNGCCTGDPIPSDWSPNGVIAGWWEDLNPSTGGTIHYQTLGTAPNRRFILQFTSVNHFWAHTPVTFQFKLFEGSNFIEVHYQHAPSDGWWHSAGIENQDGTVGLQYFRGTGSLTTPLAVRYLNSAPTIISIGETPAEVGSPLVAEFTDPIEGETHTCTIAWDGVTEPGAIVEPDGDDPGTCTGMFPAEAGIYDITVTVTDDLGASGSATIRAVVYDPSRFVTGGGWIEPPEGAFKDPSSIDPPEILVNQVIDFEDLYPGYETPDIPLPAGYAGFDWSPYSYAITKYYHAGSGYEYGTIGMVSLYTAWAADISFGGKPFDFKGAYITAAWDATENVIVEGWADGSLLYQTTITTHNDDAYWFDFEFEGVDHVWFRPQGAHIAIDDITVSFVRPTTVDDCVLPEVTCPTGKTNFGFNAKYKKNATEPTGQLEFQFRAGELNFHSSGYDWLVITPDDLAILRGSGTINGQGEYQFRLWARDGEPDTFRMRIWEVDEFGNRTPIFDNGYAQPTGGGNITVHH